MPSSFLKSLCRFCATEACLRLSRQQRSHFPPCFGPSTFSLYSRGLSFWISLRLLIFSLCQHTVVYLTFSLWPHAKASIFQGHLRNLRRSVCSLTLSAADLMHMVSVSRPVEVVAVVTVLELGRCTNAKGPVAHGQVHRRLAIQIDGMHSRTSAYVFPRTHPKLNHCCQYRGHGTFSIFCLGQLGDTNK
jgi:hypothetical protein